MCSNDWAQEMAAGSFFESKLLFKYHSSKYVFERFIRMT